MVYINIPSLVSVYNRWYTKCFFFFFFRKATYSKDKTTVEEKDCGKRGESYLCYSFLLLAARFAFLCVCINA